MFIKLWTWLSHLLFTPRKSRALDQIFRPIDPSKVIETLHVADAAEYAGKNELPQGDSTTLDATEQRIVHYFDEEAQATAYHANKKVLLYRRRIEHYDLQADINEARSAIASFETRTQGLLEESQDSLGELIAQRKTLRNELEQFKSLNELSRSGHYPESRFFLVSILVLMVVVEALANTYFFAQGNDFGLLGGLVAASAFAAVNVVAAFFITLAGVRNIVHVNGLRRLIGVVSTLVLLAWIPAFNLFVAHYRDLLADSQTAQVAQSETMLAVFTAPFALTVDSWLLFALGGIFAAIAVFDALVFDDRYPGYGGISRRYEAAKNDYLDEKQAVKDKLSNLRDASLGFLDEVKQRLEEKQAELLDLKSLCHDVLAGCRQHHFLLAQTCNVVVSKYRELNIFARTTKPPPRFEQPVQLSSDKLLGLPDAPDDGELKKQTQEAVRAMKAIEVQRQSIGEKYAQRLMRLDEEIRSLEYRSA